VRVPIGSSEDTIRETAMADAKTKSAILGKQIVKTIVVPGKLINLVVR
jgi:leucyl-tRNA synthetase